MNEKNVLEFFQRISGADMDAFEFENAEGCLCQCVQSHINGVKTVYISRLNRKYPHVSTACLRLAAIVVSPGKENSTIYITEEFRLIRRFISERDLPSNVRRVHSVRYDLSEEWQKRYFPAYWESLEPLELDDQDRQTARQEAKNRLVSGKKGDEYTADYLLPTEFTIDCLCGFQSLEDYTSTFHESRIMYDRRLRSIDIYAEELCRQSTNNG